MTTPNLNGLTPGLALLQLLWSERPKRTAQMQQSGPKYLTLVEDTGGYVAPGRENTGGLPVAITDSMLIQHLRGDTTYAAPLIGADGLAKALVIEIDSGGQAAIQSVLDCAAAARLTAFAFYVPANSNDSQHDGGHVWILYRDTWSPARLQEQSKQLLRAAGLPDDKEI